ncbi:exported hypothetical protein [Vibrio nigripulchritudo MADA3029]|uniref:hypothetical protein n=1 Tax=Vibrio nigripulchritudo TaxID=28173 RepID=UPI0003B1BC11|nr:hypothetical protein [Vibrio nigripulchritudo]CCN49414.1 exported hypothetical protein [Vibrio nigripulchritudo MADA3020]CCN53788.1 exported hypothetical protein [Vibrio nigripulchritudo MADA3021]CCN58920.1 exported hypothetical protein [Vibrio nigripulchritudo MADA3029]
MFKRIFLLGMPVLMAFCQSAYGNEWVNDVNITKLSTYQHSPIHFVWLSSGSAAECRNVDPNNPVLRFSEINPGGKSLMSVLTAAVVSKTKVDVQVKGCDIIEVYIK